MSSDRLISFEKFPKRRAFIVINKSQSTFMQLLYLIINLSTMTHPDEWAVLNCDIIKLLINFCAWFVDMYIITLAGQEAFFPPFYVEF